MKYIISFFGIVCLICILVFCPNNYKENVNSEYLRIHIRANSNSEEDQNVKYKVKEGVVDALIPLICNAKSKEDATEIINKNMKYIEKVADEILKKEGFDYTSNGKIKNEEFPTRVYENLTLEEGYYDALILNLGSGKGDNWWCVVYPPLCFLSTNNSTNYVYISKIWEIINSVTK